MGWRKQLVSAFVAGCLLVAALAVAQPPAATVPAPAAPPTFWNFLGIPQGVHKVSDAIVNAGGNHPALERKPPLKSIANPANLQSPNPAVKKAAEIKQDEDLAPQKIKAIKYLAKVACGCHPGVREALLAALDDCTEAVRYQAAMAFCQAAGDPCTTCNRGSCCSPEVQKKLKEIAFGRDATGCWKEPSCRVRVAAENALNACQAVMPEPVQPVPEPKPESIQPRPEKAPTDGPAPADGANAAGAVRPVGMEQVAPGAGVQIPTGALASNPSAPSSEGWVVVSEHGRLLRRCRPCPPGLVPTTPEAPAEPSLAPQPGVAPGQDAVPGEVTPFITEAAEPGALASSIGAVSGPRSVAPAMIGDFFGGGLYTVTEPGLGNIAIAGGDRLFKVGEDNSPLPTDRIFFNYNHFNNAAQTIDGNTVDFDRFAFGFEKTFLEGHASVEFRIPFGSGLNANQSFDPGSSLTGTEFGNIPIVTKFLLIERECNAISAGMAVVLPTARDARLLSNGRTEFLVQNEAVHLDPFLAWLWTPNDRWFTQTFLQFDFAGSGNPVYRDSNERLARAGVLQDQSLMIVDFKVGYWLYQDPCARFLTGVAPTVELHYTTTMQNADRVPGIANDFNRWDNLNLTAGLHFALGEWSTLTVFGVAPLKSDRSTSRLSSSFDGEVGVQLVRRF
jgi:hypothetical protein